MSEKAENPIESAALDYRPARAKRNAPLALAILSLFTAISIVLPIAIAKYPNPFEVWFAKSAFRNVFQGMISVSFFVIPVLAICLGIAAIKLSGKKGRLIPESLAYIAIALSTFTLLIATVVALMLMLDSEL